MEIGPGDLAGKKELHFRLHGNRRKVWREKMASTNDEAGLLKAAERIWGMLDEMAAKEPQEYKKFVEKQLQEGKEHFSPPSHAFTLKCLRASHKVSLDLKS